MNRYIIYYNIYISKPMKPRIQTDTGYKVSENKVKVSDTS